MTEYEEKVCREIGFFYYEDNQYDTLKAKSSLILTNITKVEIEHNIIHITCQRPGLLIGKKGIHITKLKSYLERKLNKGKIEINIIENNINDLLYCFDIVNDFKS